MSHNCQSNITWSFCLEWKLKKKNKYILNCKNYIPVYYNLTCCLEWNLHSFEWEWTTVHLFSANGYIQFVNFFVLTGIKLSFLLSFSDFSSSSADRRASRTWPTILRATSLIDLLSTTWWENIKHIFISHLLKKLYVITAPYFIA